MNAKSAALLVNPHPCGHIVYPYTDETLVGQAVCLFASAGIQNGEGVILIMTRAHRDSITLRLAAEGFDVEALQKSGRLVCRLAEDLLTEFMVDGTPDENAFKAIVGRIILKCQASTGKARPPRVRLFGEMVSLLWNANLAATTSLEEWWNEIVDAYGVSLLCTYDMQGASTILPHSLIAAHSHQISSQAN